MKLELKHLAPYLPYGISIEVSEYNNKYITDSWGLKCQSDYLVSEYNRGVRKGLTLTQVKPILRPISDLEKKIEYQGKKIAGFQHLKGTDYLKFPMGILKFPENMCISSYLFLTEMHFDVFGLIDAGLAIDINTLNN